MFKFFKYLFLCIFVIGVLTVAGVVGGLYYLVVVEPGSEIEAEYIENILGRESPVYYRDGEAQLGVLFHDVHRQYLGYDDIPEHFINAIVAAEDSEFFSHYGVDIPGITRAMIANFKAGRIVQGGSTLTQQTAKNLFKRESRSYKAKLKELLYALRLEYKYPKEKILEFYSNQFFVSGNGHGLGVAARYYFNKEPQDLELLECVYIAGSVKRPNYYNPFTKRNIDNPEAAREKVDQRIKYVLARMLKGGKLTPHQYDSVLAQEVFFDRGKMSFPLNTSMDLIREGLGTETVEKILEENGIYNVSTSGIKVIATVEKDIQQKTLYSLRRQLSILDVRINGFERETIQEKYRHLEYKGDKELQEGAFVFGTIIDKKTVKGKGLVITVGFENNDFQAVIDDAGIDRIVSALTKYRKDRWAEPGKADRKKLLAQLQSGDTVYLSLRALTEEGLIYADLEKYPTIEGGVLALQEGVIRAMAGGSTDRFFNRAVDAKRLMGSTLKPFLFAAAMQLGWGPVDILNNRSDVFVFMDKPYFPRPDHTSPHDEVTMSWTGVTSENLAAIWLLYHLTDHLTPPRLREVAAQMDMAPRVEDEYVEPYQTFTSRIRDEFGVLVNRGAIKKAAFDKAKKTLRTDFLFDNRLDEYEHLERLHYGLNYEKYIKELERAVKSEKLKKRQVAVLKKRISLLRNSFLDLEKNFPSFQIFKNYVEAEAEKVDNLFGSFFNEPTINYSYGYLVQDNEQKAHFTMQRDNLSEKWSVWPLEQVISFVASLNEQQKRVFWNSVWLEGKVTVASFTELTGQMKTEEDKLFQLKPYSMELLSEVRDYRVMLGLQYLLNLGKECGIQSNLEPVLSFPLGSNVITLLEAVRLYEVLVTGKRFTVEETMGHDFEDLNYRGSDGLALIERIEAPDGEVIYQQKVSTKQIFDKKTAAAVSNILENTIRYGTGRFAYNNVKIHSSDLKREKELSSMRIKVPLLGKTGTANQYRNASFLGFVPLLANQKDPFLTTTGGYSVGAYTGFDTNGSMVKGNTRISGSSGALPVWAPVAEVLLEHEGVGDRLDLIDLAFNGLSLKYPPVGQYFVPVITDGSGKVNTNVLPKQQATPPALPTSLAFGRVVGQGDFEPERFFQPFWRNE